MNPSIALLVGASALGGAALGAWFCAWRLGRQSSPRPRLPDRWPLRTRLLVSSSERQVWHWLKRSLHDHEVMLKLPVLRFTMLHEAHSPGAADSGRSDAAVHAGAQLQREQWLALLGNIRTTFTVCTADGRVVGCVDVSGQSSLSTDRRELKEALLSDCGIAYVVVNVLDLPATDRIRAALLGELPVEAVVEHQVTRGGDSDFHADLSAFTRQHETAARRVS